MPGFRFLAVLAAVGISAFLIWDAVDSEDRCASLTSAEAVAMATEAKRAMLGRSTEAYRANYASDAVVAVELPPLANGYAAKVIYRGRDGGSLMTLIENDCYIGWTGQ